MERKTVKVLVRANSEINSFLTRKAYLDKVIGNILPSTTILDLYLEMRVYTFNNLIVISEQTGDWLMVDSVGGATAKKRSDS